MSTRTTGNTPKAPRGRCLMKGSQPASSYIEIHEYDSEPLLVREDTVDDIYRDKHAKGDPAPYVVTRTSGQRIRVSEREARRLVRLLKLGAGGAA